MFVICFYYKIAEKINVVKKDTLLAEKSVAEKS